jgi:glycosyltransferase involved in cell wall biosynthesis
MGVDKVELAIDLSINAAAESGRGEAIAGEVVEAVDDRGWQVPEGEHHELAPRRTRYCICIPVLNEGERIRTQLRTLHALGPAADLIIADGASSDGALEVEFLRAHGVRTLLVKRAPGGQSAQLRMAFAYAMRQGYDGVVQVDGNNKDGMDAIPRFLDALAAGADYVQGDRFAPGGEHVNTPLLRLWAIRAIHAPLVSLAARRWLHDTTNGFRAYSRRYLLHPGVRPFRSVFLTYELNWYLSARASQLGLNVRELPVSRRYPAGAVPTKISPIKGTSQMLYGLVRLLTGGLHPH